MKNSSKRNPILYSIITAMVLFGTTQFSKAQTIYKIVNGKESFVKVLGSSNVHDWEMNSTIIESQGDFKVDGDLLKSLGSFTFSVEAKSLKSEHASMDDRTYKTIKADQFPKITFKLTSSTITTLQKGKFLIKAKGDLAIAGGTQSITIDVTATLNADNTITCTGNQKLKLTDYKISPPSFMLGAMKVKDDLKIQFNIIYKK